MLSFPLVYFCVFLWLPRGAGRWKGLWWEKKMRKFSSRERFLCRRVFCVPPRNKVPNNKQL